MKNNILEAHLYQKIMYMTTGEKKIGFRRCVNEKKNHVYTPPEKETDSKSPTPPSKVVGDAPLSI